MGEERIIVSACLCGFNCRYNGKRLKKRTLPFDIERAIFICPEVLGGLKIPRTPSFFNNEKTGFGVLDGETRVISVKNEDRTENFLIGAKKALQVAVRNDIKLAYLKERSPSCGVKQVYVNNNRVSGKGVTTALFERNKIKVIGVD